ncbi:MAG: hypothetical protein ABR548_03985 [Actinomycetota bacterium]|nr:hypothetical protein [Actinomycetota bacterium]
MTDKPHVSGLRTLGAPAAPKTKKPRRTPEEKALAAKAVETLRSEFARALALKQKLSGEQNASADLKGRDAGEAEKLRSIVASLEGMSRFAIAMGMLTPQENRAIWAEHIKLGLYEGWR